MLFPNLHAEISLEEVKFDKGEAAASSFTTYDGKEYVASEAFQMDETKYWRSNNDLPSSFIWYEFNEEHIPANISFLSPDPGSAPTEYAFIGSNPPSCNAASDWVTLCNRSYEITVTSVESHGCQVDRGLHREKFRCLGLKVSAIGLGKNIREGVDVTVSMIRIWEVIE